MMTREEYLGLRGSTSYNLLYEYYKEMYDGQKHQPFLQFMDFVNFMQMWPGIRGSYEKVLEYYDQKFNVNVVMDKNGNIITYS
jgi:hypothetical protein